MHRPPPIHRVAALPLLALFACGTEGEDVTVVQDNRPAACDEAFDVLADGLQTGDEILLTFQCVNVSGTFDPFVDVLTTMLDDTLPLTPPEWPEWGNPILSEADFRTILAYSPYDNVGPLRYPAILALGGLTDPRVTYWEPAKWVAKLRDKAVGSPLVLLKTNMDAGHGGAAGRFDRLQESAFSMAFALKVTAKA